jgi:hypothetical protein
MAKSTMQIEFPSVGQTYAHNVYAVYEYGIYPRSSVLAGRSRRVFLDSFDTLDEARAAYPSADERIFEPLSENEMA